MIESIKIGRKIMDSAFYSCNLFYPYEKSFGNPCYYVQENNGIYFNQNNKGNKFKLTEVAKLLPPQVPLKKVKLSARIVLKDSNKRKADNDLEAAASTKKQKKTQVIWEQTFSTISHNTNFKSETQSPLQNNTNDIILAIPLIPLTTFIQIRDEKVLNYMDLISKSDDVEKVFSYCNEMIPFDLTTREKNQLVEKVLPDCMVKNMICENEIEAKLFIAKVFDAKRSETLCMREREAYRSMAQRLYRSLSFSVDAKYGYNVFYLDLLNNQGGFEPNPGVHTIRAINNLNLETGSVIMTKALLAWTAKFSGWAGINYKKTKKYVEKAASLGSKIAIELVPFLNQSKSDKFVDMMSELINNPETIYQEANQD